MQVAGYGVSLTAKYVYCIDVCRYVIPSARFLMLNEIWGVVCLGEGGFSQYSKIEGVAGEYPRPRLRTL